MKIKSEAEEEGQMLLKLTPGTEDFKKHENRVTELKARLAAGREQAQREFQSRESENVATIYKEVQLMVTAIAQWRKINYVVRVTNLQPNGSRSQYGHGCLAEHDGLLRPAQRHHERRDLQPQPPLQGCEPLGRLEQFCRAAASGTQPASGRRRCRRRPR